MSDDFISQEEIDALLSGGSLDALGSSPPPQEEVSLTEAEIDALGELGNISMGTSATTMSDILGKKVEITTPTVSMMTLEQIKEQYIGSYVMVKVEYTKGVDGINFLLLNEKDVKIITDLMMGGDGQNLDGEINDLHLSAIGEAMNQMVGSSATSLAKIFETEIDISPPVAKLISSDKEASDLDVLKKSSTLVIVNFRMVVQDLIDSQVFQIQTVEFAKEQSARLLSMMKEETVAQQSMNTPQKPAEKVAPQPPKSSSTPKSETNSGVSQRTQQGFPNPNMQQGNMGQGNIGQGNMQQGNMGQGNMPYGGGMQQGNMGQGNMGQGNMGQGNMAYGGGMQQGNMGQGNMGQGNMGQGNMGQGNMAYGGGMQQGNMGQGNMGQGGDYTRIVQPPNRDMIDVQPASFQSFDEGKVYFEQKNIDLIMDVPLQVTVELGRTKKLIKEILEFGAGSIIELEKLAEEPVDILVNGKVVARGEVVVIDECFCVRITEILQNSLQF